MKLRLAFILLAGMLAVRIVASLAPSPWLWGLDSLADRSTLLKAIGLLLFSLALVPGIAAGVVRLTDRLLRTVPAPLLATLGLSTALLLLFLLPSKNLLLGDSQVYLSSLAQGVRVAGGAHREPLAQALITGIHTTVGTSLGWTTQETFRAAGLVLGALFVTLGSLLARRLAGTTAARLVIFSAIVLGGGLQLFSGYAEFYGFALVGILLFAYLGLRSLEGKASLYPAVAAFLFAALSHAQVLFTTPALVHLVVTTWRRGRRREAVLAVLLIPILAFLTLLVLRYPFADLAREATRSGAFLPPLGTQTGRTPYPILSLPHLVELANVALLVAPILPAIAVLWLRHPPLRPGRGLFLGSLAAGPILFALIANPQLGMVRDWDIFVLPLTLAALWMAAGAGSLLERQRRRAIPLAGMLALTSLLHGIFWVSSNHHARPSGERLRRVASNASVFGPQSHGEIWRYIGGAEKREGMDDRSVESFLEAVRANPNERMSYRLLAGVMVSQAVKAGRSVEEGLADYHSILSGVEHRTAYAHLGGCFASLAAGRQDLALAEARRMVDAEPDYPELLATWGDLLRRAGRFGQAEAAYTRALARDPDHPRARIGMACLAGVRGDLEGLRALVAETLRRTPWSPQAQQFAKFLERPGMLTPEQCRMHLYIQ